MKEKDEHKYINNNFKYTLRTEICISENYVASSSSFVAFKYLDEKKDDDDDDDR
jgi:hypothetical protein